MEVINLGQVDHRMLMADGVLTDALETAIVGWCRWAANEAWVTAIFSAAVGFRGTDGLYVAASADLMDADEPGACSASRLRWAYPWRAALNGPPLGLLMGDRCPGSRTCQESDGLLRGSQ